MMKCEICEIDLFSSLLSSDYDNAISSEEKAICNKCIIEAILCMSPKTFRCADCKTIYPKKEDTCPKCKMGNPTKSPFFVEED